MGRTVCIGLDIERREKEKDANYERNVPLTTSPASRQLYIHATGHAENIASDIWCLDATCTCLGSSGNCRSLIGRVG